MLGSRKFDLKELVFLECTRRVAIRNKVSVIPGVWRYETGCRLYLACGHAKQDVGVYLACGHTKQDVGVYLACGDAKQDVGVYLACGDTKHGVEATW